MKAKGTLKTRTGLTWAIVLMFACTAVIAQAVKPGGQESKGSKGKDVKKSTIKFPHYPLFNGQVVSVDLGKFVNGDLDVTNQIQALLNDAARWGGVLQLPPGKFKIAGSINIPKGVTLQGSWQSSVHYLTTDKNTVLYLTGGRGNENGPGAINLTTDSGIIGFSIAYPEQTFPNVAAYPWAIIADGYAVHIENITFVNAYQGIRLGINESSLHFVKNIYGTVLRRGLFVDACYDVGRIENVHFNEHYYARSDIPGAPRGGLPNNDQYVANYARKHLEAFIIARDEWGSIKDTFVYGAKIAYRFITTDKGSFNGKLIGAGADGGWICLSIEQKNPYGMLIIGGQFVSHPALKEQKGPWVYVYEEGLEAIEVVTTPGSDTPVQFLNCSFWGGSQHIAKLEGEGFVSFNQCIFRGWDVKKQDKAAIQALNGKVSVTNCQFLEWPGQTLQSVFIGSNVTGAKVIGNMASSQVRITNQIGDKAEIHYNDGQ